VALVVGEREKVRGINLSVSTTGMRCSKRIVLYYVCISLFSCSRKQEEIKSSQDAASSPEQKLLDEAQRLFQSGKASEGESFEEAYKYYMESMAKLADLVSKHPESALSKDLHEGSIKIGDFTLQEFSEKYLPHIQTLATAEGDILESIALLVSSLPVDQDSDSLRANLAEAFFAAGKHERAVVTAEAISSDKMRAQVLTSILVSSDSSSGGGNTNNGSGKANEGDEKEIASAIKDPYLKSLALMDTIFSHKAGSATGSCSQEICVDAVDIPLDKEEVLRTITIVLKEIKSIKGKGKKSDIMEKVVWAYLLINGMDQVVKIAKAIPDKIVRKYALYDAAEDFAREGLVDEVNRILGYIKKGGHDGTSLKSLAEIYINDGKCDEALEMSMKGEPACGSLG
jgi:hypothetical protein